MSLAADLVVLGQVARYCHVKANFYAKYGNVAKEKFWRDRATALERVLAEVRFAQEKE